MGIAVAGFSSGFPGCTGAISSLLETLVFRVLLCPAIGKAAAPSLHRLLLSGGGGGFFPHHTNARCSVRYLNLRQLLSKPLSETSRWECRKINSAALQSSETLYLMKYCNHIFRRICVISRFSKRAVLEMPAWASICPGPPLLLLGAVICHSLISPDMVGSERGTPGIPGKGHGPTQDAPCRSPVAGYPFLQGTDSECSDLCQRPPLSPPRLKSALIRGWISKPRKCPLSSLPQISQLSFSPAYISYSNTNKAVALNPRAAYN